MGAMAELEPNAATRQATTAHQTTRERRRFAHGPGNGAIRAAPYERPSRNGGGSHTPSPGHGGFWERCRGILATKWLLPIPDLPAARLSETQG